MIENIKTHLLSEAAAIMAAPVTFVSAMLVVSGVIWWAVNWSYAARLESVKARLEARMDEVSRLRTEIEAARRAPPSPQAEKMSNPDAILQAGREVGEAVAPDMRRGEGIVAMDRLDASGDFDPQKPFEFRDLRLCIQSFSGSTRVGFAGMLRQQFTQVICRID